MQRTSRSLRARIYYAFLAFTLLLFTSCLQANAQNINAGEIRGIVTDSTGAAVPQVVVSAKNIQTGVVTKVTANSQGLYNLPQLTPGTYTVTFTAGSFKTYSQENVLLQNAPITVNAVLVIGSATEQITVNSGSIVQLQTEDSEQSLTLDEETLTAVPNIGNSMFNETVLIPGVSGGGSQNQNGSSIGINGAQAYNENFLLNGGTATFIGSQNPDWTIAPTDFIAETDFQTHSFNATSGNGLAVLNVITKNGTNQFHGSFWDYNQNSTFAAPNYFSGGSGVPPLSSNTFGGTVGGPIKRDKLFFFGGYQRTGSKSGTVGFSTVPTSDMKAGKFDPTLFPTIFDPTSTTTVGGKTERTAFTNNQIPTGMLNQQALNWQKYLPAPNWGAAGAITNNYRYSTQANNVSTWETWKIDYTLNDKNHINTSGTWGTVQFPDVAPLDPIGAFAENGNEVVPQISWTWTPSSSAVNEMRGSMMRFWGKWPSGDRGMGIPKALGIPNSVSDVWPGLNITGLYNYGAGLNAFISETTITPADVFTLIRGKHIMKFGGEFDDDEVNGNFAAYSDGSFSFNGDSTLDPLGKLGTGSDGVGYADFLLGDVSSWSIALTPESAGRLKSYQMFAQDDYKIKPNLTVNLGLRFEVQPGWKEAHNLQGDFDPTLNNPATKTPGAMWYADGASGVSSRTTIEALNNIIQPRVGFSWSPIHNWDIRGGFGYYTEMLGQNTYQVNTDLGIAGTNNLTETDSLTPVFNLAQGPPLPIYTTVNNLTPELFNGQSISYIPYHTKVPYMEEYQVGIQHEFHGGIIADAAYVGSSGRRLAVSMDSNQVPQSEIGNFANGANMAQYRPYQQYGNIATTLGEGTSHYDSLQARMQKQYANSLQFAATFTYSHTLDDQTGSGNGGPGAKGDVWQNGYSLKSNYGNSLLNQPISFNGDVVYDLPFGRGKLFMNQGGIANEVLGGWRLSGLWQIHSGTPFTVTIPTNLSGSLAGTWFPNRTRSGKLSHPTVAEWFDPTAFSQPANGTFGNSGRDILSGPAWRQLDMSMQKHWALKMLGEMSDIQVRVDAADVLNHPNFGNPSGSLTQNATSGGWNLNPITSANTSRTVQFEGKFSF
jgi:hypothetical protein